MLIPKEIFPENKVDPTVDPKQHEMSVEQTLGAVGHVRSTTRKRGKNWRFLQNTENLSDEQMAAKIRDLFDLPNTARIFEKDNTWAAWIGEGTPDANPFGSDEAPEPDAVVLKAIVEEAPPGTVLSVAGDLTKSRNGSSHTTPDLPQKVKVSPHVPSAALNDMGLRLYAMSKEQVYSEPFRKFLLQVSDAIHAEASKIDLVKVRASYDRKSS